WPLLVSSREEIFQTDIEGHGDADQSRQRGYKPAVLELTQHRGGEPGLTAEIHERNFLSEPQLAQLSADFVGRQDAADRVVATLRISRTHGTRSIMSRMSTVLFLMTLKHLKSQKNGAAASRLQRFNL